MKIAYRSKLLNRFFRIIAIVSIPLFTLQIVILLKDHALAKTDAVEREKLIIRTFSQLQRERTNSVLQTLTVLAKLPDLGPSKGERLYNKLFEEMAAQSPVFYELIALAPDGRSFISSTPDKAVVNNSDRAYFKAVMTTKSPAISDYIIARKTHLPTIAYAVPSFGEDGKTIRSIVAAGANLDWLASTLNEFPLPPDSLVTVRDRNGIILASTPSIGGVVGTNNGIISQMARESLQGVYEGKDIDNVNRLYCFENLGTDYGDIVVSIGIPSEFIYFSANRTLLISLACLVLIQLFAAGAAAFSAQRLILRPIDKLVEATRSIENGSREAHLSLVVDDTEIGQVSRAVKAMTDALIQEERALRQSNEYLEQFAYVASHDLQEPLRMVTSYLQLIENRYRSVLDDDGREFIGFAVDGAQRMRNLIEDLLAYSRVTGKAKPFREIACEEIMETVVENLSVAIEEANASVRWESLPVVFADAGQLVQLFQNLVGNALKYRGEADPRVTISAERRDAFWYFTVSDNGIGIEPQYFERIFVIFQRLHTRQEYAGTGIGLALCKRIVERHGGTMGVESTPGVGSTFYFTLPYHG